MNNITTMSRSARLIGRVTKTVTSPCDRVNARPRLRATEVTFHYSSQNEHQDEGCRMTPELYEVVAEQLEGRSHHNVKHATLNAVNPRRADQQNGGVQESVWNSQKLNPQPDQLFSPW